MVSLMPHMVRARRREHIRGTPRRAAPMMHDEGPAGRGRDAVRHVPDARQPARRRVARRWPASTGCSSTSSTAAATSRCCSASCWARPRRGVHALVRVESDVRGRTARALDLGVEGVMCPQVNSAEAAAAWAAALHYGTGRGDRAVPPRRALRHRPGRDRERARADLRDRADRVARRRSRRSRRSPRSTASTCCSSARATCRSRWACSASSTTRSSARRSSASTTRRGTPARRPGSSSRRPTRCRRRSRTGSG